MGYYILAFLTSLLVSASGFDWKYAQNMDAVFRRHHHYHVQQSNEQQLTNQPSAASFENSPVESFGMNIHDVIREFISNSTTPLEIPPGVSQECTTAGMKLIAPLMKIPTTAGKIQALFYLPVGKMLDAFGKFPERFLLGKFFLLKLSNTAFF